VIDDEPLAREGVRALLSSDPEVEVVDVCASGVSAVRKIVDLSPDLVFLDIQMPGMNGFDVIRAIGTEDMPVVIFATAYDRYALDAFEAHAVEYLLKPFSDERFHEALARGKLAVRERGWRSSAKNCRHFCKPWRAVDHPRTTRPLPSDSPYGARDRLISCQSRTSTGSRGPTIMRAYTRRGRRTS
jgi:YesN/AraC family two-component response regulator